MPWASGRIPYTAGPKTECVAADRVAASPKPQPQSLIAMSYGGRNVTVGNPMPWAWPGAEEEGACAMGVKVAEWKRSISRLCSLALPGLQGSAEEASPPSPGCPSCPSSPL